MLSAVAITLPLHFLLLAPFPKAQAEEIPDEANREASHPVNNRVGQLN
jgi:hypothetical protein